MWQFLSSVILAASCCSGDEIDQTTTSTTSWTRPPAEFDCPREEDNTCIDYRYPYPWDCEQYYRCFGDYDCVVYTFYCPDGLHFSPEHQDCVDAAIANCTGEWPNPLHMN